MCAEPLRAQCLMIVLLQRPQRTDNGLSVMLKSPLRSAKNFAVFLAANFHVGVKHNADEQVLQVCQSGRSERVREGGAFKMLKWL